jgi:hypothetical protein
VSDRELVDEQDDGRKKITRIEMGRKMLVIGSAYSVKVKGEQLENQKKTHGETGCLASSSGTNKNSNPLEK